tara:strand:- start:41166 stop:42251 length:1086 start_codon:yes stop_codon:yes gene_type:complete
MYFSNLRHPQLELKPEQQTNNIELFILDETNRARWDEFATSHCEHPFHLSVWEKIFSELFFLKTYYLYAQKGKDIIAILPLVEMKSLLFGHALISTPFLVYGGPVGTKDGCDKLVARAVELGKEKQVDYIELKCEHPNVDIGWEQEIYFNFKRPIISEHECNLKDIPRKQRAVVRKADKSGLMFEFENNIEKFYRLYATSLRNLGTPVMPKDFFQKIFDSLGDKCSILTISHPKDHQPLSSVMSFYHNNSVLPYYAGGSLAARNSKSNDFMYWQLMKDAVNKSLTEFNFGRSKVDTGSYRFKKHWGFEAQPLHYRTILIKAKQPPNLNPTNPKYQLMIKAWKKLPISMSMILGPWIARRLG